MSSTLRGEEFEQRVLSLFETDIACHRFVARPECCAIYHRKSYYSRDRRSDIVFDVAIELTLPGANHFSMVWLIECKHYTHPVPVDDVEEFFSKVQQVAAANAKAVIVTTNSFQRGALEYARSKGIGLVRVFPPSELKWVLHRSHTSLGSALRNRDSSFLYAGFLEEHHRPERNDVIFRIGNFDTCSLQDFSLAFARACVSDASLAAIAPVQSVSDAVPFVTQDEIERVCTDILDTVGYKRGAVSLDAVCDWQNKQSGLIVIHEDGSTRDGRTRDVLGRISFRPPRITLYRDTVSVERQRFTLAHELGHLLLGHGDLLMSESVEVSDIENTVGSAFDEDELRRLEWQANCFASYLLLPTKPFLAATFEQARKMDLHDRGHGLIYLDDQPVNRQTYRVLTSVLMQAFDVSRVAAKLRLQNLGLLNELRAPDPWAMQKKRDWPKRA